MKRIVYLPLCMALAAAATPVKANPVCDNAAAEAKAYLKETGKPGIAVGVVQEGRIICALNFGVTDFTTNAPITTQTNFHLASVSKPIAAIAAMQLVFGKEA